MAFDVFIHFDGIEGEGNDESHAGWMEIENFHMAHSHRISTTDSSAGGATTARTDFGEFTFEKMMDLATPHLALFCADGTHINKIVVEVCRAGKEKVKFMEYRFENCLISAFTSSSYNGEYPIDDVAINFGKVEWRYIRQNRTGGVAQGSVAAGWDLEKNCRI